MSASLAPQAAKDFYINSTSKDHPKSNLENYLQSASEPVVDTWFLNPEIYKKILNPPAWQHDNSIHDDSECLKTQETQKLHLRVAQANDYTSSNFRFGERASRGENVKDADLVQTFPFHPKSPSSFYKNISKTAQSNMAFCQVFKLPELCTQILAHLAFNDKKNFALASKTNYFYVGTFYEVWDTNAGDFLNNDLRDIYVESIESSESPVMPLDSWCLNLKRKLSAEIERYLHHHSYIEKHRNKSGKIIKFVHFTEVKDKMMISELPKLPEKNTNDRSCRARGRHVMMTAVRFEASAETKFKSPRLRYGDAFLNLLRGFEAINNTGRSIQSLDVSGQAFFIAEMVDVMLTALPNLKLLTLRDNHLMRFTDTQELMEMVHRHVPGCTLDFHPYYFYGPPAPEDGFDCATRQGSFGLTWEDSGVCTEKAIALFIRNIRHWEEKYGMRVLEKGAGLYGFLKRLPLSPDFVDNVMDSLDELRRCRNPEEREAAVQAHYRRVHRWTDVHAEPLQRHELLQCRDCSLESARFLMHHHYPNSALPTCAWCSLCAHAYRETDRYRHEKVFSVERLFRRPDGLPVSSLGELFEPDEATAAPEPHDENKTAAGSLGSRGPWAPPTLSKAEGRAWTVLKDCLLLERVRLRDLSRLQPGLGLGLWRGRPGWEGRIRRPGRWADRGPGDHEFAPQQHPNVHATGFRAVLAAGANCLSYSVSPTDEEFMFSSPRSYCRANDWDRERQKFGLTETQIDMERRQQRELPWYR